MLSALLIMAAVIVFGAEPQSVKASGVGTITGITTIASNDSNNPSTDGPRAMYLEADFKNTSGATITGVTASLDLSSLSCAGFALGGSPTTQVNPLTSTQEPALASIPNNGVVHLYWYITYPTTNGNACNYTVNITSSGGPGSGTGTITTLSAISASAGGQVSSLVAGPVGAPGTSVDVTAGYDFGNPGTPPQMAFQPAGNTSFNAGCFQLTNEVITAVTGYTGGPALNDANILQYNNVVGVSHNTLSVKYTFLVLCANVTTTLDPFAFQESGSAAMKYTGNFAAPGAFATTPLMGSQINPVSASGVPVSVTDTVYLQNATGTSTLPTGHVVFSLCGPFDIPPTVGTHPLPGNGQACNTDGSGNITGAFATSGSIALTTAGTSPNQYTTAPWTQSITTFGEWCFAAVYTPDVTAYTTTTLNKRSTSVPSHVPGSLPGTECITIQNATAVTLSSFSAKAQGFSAPGQISVAWATGSEINTAGFNLYRSESAQGPYVRINSELIPASNDALAGGKYQYLDKNTVAGHTYYYQLEDIELNGASVRHPAVKVTAANLAESSAGPLILIGLGFGFLALASGGAFLLRRNAKKS